MTSDIYEFFSAKVFAVFQQIHGEYKVASYFTHRNWSMLTTVRLHIGQLIYFYDFFLISSYLNAMTEQQKKIVIIKKIRVETI